MLALLLTFALQEPVGPFDPVRHESLDRTWAIEIDPLESRGAGAADYRFLHAGELVWSGRLPFALDQLRVTDDGFVVGCASTLGRGAWEGELLVVRITPAGVARVCAVAPKKGPDAPHGPSSPLVVAVKTFAEPAHFRVELEGLRKDRLTTIWSFGLPDGAPITSAPREKSPWFEREWTPDPIDEPRPVESITSLDVRSLPVLHAEALGELRLATRVESSALVAVARDGSIAVLDGESGAFSVHDADGHLRATAVVKLEKYPQGLDALADGNWVLQGSVWALLDKSGAIVESRPRQWGARELPVIGDASRRVWRVEARGVELRTTSGVTKQSTERGPDRRWFRRLADLLVTPDGGAVVIEDLRHDPDGVIHVFSADGVRVGSLGIPEAPWQTRASVAGHTVFVRAGYSDVLAIDTRTLNTSRVSMGGPDRLRGCVALVPSPDGRELWCFTKGTAVVTRFGLPDELK